MRIFIYFTSLFTFASVSALALQGHTLQLLVYELCILCTLFMKCYVNFVSFLLRTPMNVYTPCLLSNL
jgi:hypothetical protein